MPLTKEQLEQHPAGRELDALIAVHFFGYRKVANPFPGGQGFFYETPAYQQAIRAGQLPPRYGVCIAAEVEGGREAVIAGRVPKEGWPNELIDFYSTDIAAAKQVQAKLFAAGYDLQIWHSHDPLNGHPFQVQASKNAYGSLQAPDSIWASAETEELAICRAALLTLLSAP